MLSRDFKFGSLFAGIGGFDLGFERAGMKCAWQVEKNKFCQKVLKKHWPDVQLYGDIADVKGENLETVELISGGFPCQPFSNAGDKRGPEDDRYLWPEMFRLICEKKPAWVVCENVVGIVNMALDKTLTDLESEGYQVQTFNIPAVAVDACHERKRIWIIAYAHGNDEYACAEHDEAGELPKLDVSNSKSNRSTTFPRENKMRCNVKKASPSSGTNNIGRKYGTTMDKSGIRGIDYGIPPWLDGSRLINYKPKNYGNRLRGLGNAVVPQISKIIGNAILDTYHGNNS